MRAIEAKRLQEVEQENVRHMCLPADAELNQAMLKPQARRSRLSSRGKLLSLERRRKAFFVLQDRLQVSKRQACRERSHNGNI